MILYHQHKKSLFVELRNMLRTWMLATYCDRSKRLILRPPFSNTPDIAL